MDVAAEHAAPCPGAAPLPALSFRLSEAPPSPPFDSLSDNRPDAPPSPPFDSLSDNRPDRCCFSSQNGLLLADSLRDLLECCRIPPEGIGEDKLLVEGATAGTPPEGRSADGSLVEGAAAAARATHRPEDASASGALTGPGLMPHVECPVLTPVRSTSHCSSSTPFPPPPPCTGLWLSGGGSWPAAVTVRSLTRGAHCRIAIDQKESACGGMGYPMGAKRGCKEGGEGEGEAGREAEAEEEEEEEEVEGG